MKRLGPGLGPTKYSLDVCSHCYQQHQKWQWPLCLVICLLECSFSIRIGSWSPPNIWGQRNALYNKELKWQAPLPQTLPEHNQEPSLLSPEASYTPTRTHPLLNTHLGIQPPWFLCYQNLPTPVHLEALIYTWRLWSARRSTSFSGVFRQGAQTQTLCFFISTAAGALWKQVPGSHRTPALSTACSRWHTEKSSSTTRSPFMLAGYSSMLIRLKRKPVGHSTRVSTV